MRILATKKVLVPLATAAVAGALAVGSGADFSSTSGNTASTVTAGTLAQTNSKSGSSILSLANMKPGDSVYGQVTITNSGSLGSVFSVTQTDTSTFSSGVLTEKIEDVTNTSSPVTVYSGAFGSAGTKSLGTWAAGEAHTYRITVTLASSATNTEQGKSASASFSWNGTQSSATVTNADTGAVTPAA
ncbi:TasA family protein [Intrasporangium flavum]|uniref:TasA family protein n=1 Tax=Intrasporangium flavum TaxID=1428657 RepID=UPI00096F9B6B|nr:TasA family protein [Intrasporangium flavum]